MKLRLHNNTLRFRLSQSEVNELGEGGRIMESIRFAEDQALRYSIEPGDVQQVSAAFEANMISVKLPAVEVRLWAEGSQVSIGGAHGPVKVLVEKDFECLHGDSAENADTFPNPLVTKT